MDSKSRSCPASRCVASTADRSGTSWPNGKKSILARMDFFPFGQEVPDLSAVDATHRLAGHERDFESMLDYMKARYYASSLGRFLSPDSIDDVNGSNPQSWNSYAYTRNN